MKRTLALLAAGCLLGGAGQAYAGGLDLRGGIMFPRVDSNLFYDDAALYGTTKSDWQGFFGGGDFSFNPTDRVEVGLGVDVYHRTLHTSYRDYVSDTGREIMQDLEVNSVPVGFTVRFLVADPHAAVVPYLGGGLDAVFWEYREEGDFVAFDSPGHPIIPDSFVSDGTAFGQHVVGGLRFRLSDDFQLGAEGRYMWAKADMGEDFRGNRIDLSGPAVTVTLHVKF